MKFYRYEEMAYESGPQIREVIFHLVKETTCGYWIHPRANFKKGDLEFYPWQKPKWVSKTSRKRFAYPTQEEALKGFIARKVRQVGILRYKLRDAEQLLKMARAKLLGERESNLIEMARMG
jgi:hypothetical protein